MKVHQVLLFLPLLAVDHACHATCPEEEFPGFVFFENKDSHGNDIPSQPGYPNPVVGDLDEVFEECETDESCKAFNTWGYLKHTVAPLNVINWPGNCHGVYIKCRNWADLVLDVINGEEGNSTHPTPYFLCSGTHITDSGILLDEKFVTIGCSDPILGCVVDANPNVQYAFKVGDPNFSGLTLSDITLKGFDKAVYSVESSVEIKNCNIKNNDRGLECSGGTAVVTDSIFDENKFFGAIRAKTSCSLTVSGSTFTNNEVSKSGGALRCSGSSCTVSNSVFDGNKATNKGGAIYCNSGGVACDIDLDSCSFKDNVAGDDGGNIYFESALTCSFGSSN